MPSRSSRFNIIIALICFRSYSGNSFVISKEEEEGGGAVNMESTCYWNCASKVDSLIFIDLYPSVANFCFSFYSSYNLRRFWEICFQLHLRAENKLTYFITLFSLIYFHLYSYHHDLGYYCRSINV